jgi:hypothetical protein
MSNRNTINKQTHSRFLLFRRVLHPLILALVMFATIGLLPVLDCQAAVITVPNSSFESPPVPPVSPYASPDIDFWQKSSQPSWYNPAQNSNTPWEYLMGEFYNVPFPGQFIDNCDGNQAAFLFALPEVALFQDYSSIYGTNTAPSHSFNTQFNVGRSYDLTVAVLGGGGSMRSGASLQVGLYYRDVSNNIVVVAATSITNSAALFPTNTHFIDFVAHLPQVNPNDPWARQNIGIQLLSTVSLDLAGGYWDVDNVRLVETGVVLVNAELTNGLLSFAVDSQPGTQVEIQATTNLAAGSSWIRVGTLTNTNGVLFLAPATNLNWRYFRARQF